MREVLHYSIALVLRAQSDANLTTIPKACLYQTKPIYTSLIGKETGMQYEKINQRINR